VDHKRKRCLNQGRVWGRGGVINTFKNICLLCTFAPHLHISKYAFGRYSWKQQHYCFAHRRTVNRI